MSRLIEGGPASRCVTALAACLVVLSTPNLCLAQTLMQRLACTGDAMRLCRDFVPNHKLVAQCMEVKHDLLSRRCRAVFDAGMKAHRGQIP